MKKILFIDDDKKITSVFNDSFKDFFDITSFNYPELALSDLRKNPDYDVVISDFIMDEMNGGDFLEQVKSLNPNIIRILITGYRGSTEIERHLKNNIAQGIIFKPWDFEHVIEMITKPDILLESKSQY